ncbi:uncharacterized protein MONOS_2861 [Monocercomonoides exilis]|uniref:uncharacterized protein n=1 Tax=Monocercomonoides exilis TaxID=2049356 RepID=UPI00355AAEF2|nr:hypothetical protein MONOS_2861 [Monocercomonoides exilis]|eukprot:MONOS_2861.1-p1 / transcript=MONOS_2861.1 / gene=MONOS_2861 / organism=Monocercomonoides_exilis_PA203 / gene_product=unspecified product / transcript_product=unspecified product / location=Mono_scaffold00062:38059-41046(-) / protein_length=996 / sequence_SO=supercontig / SO=protein_coding / is_pseudo=false
MFSFVSVLCCICVADCFEKKGSADIRNREKGDAFFSRDVNCVSEGIDNLNSDTIAYEQDQRENHESKEDFSDTKNETNFGDSNNKSSFLNLDDFSSQKENEKSFTEGHAKIMYKELQRNDEYDIKVDGENGIDSEECGISVHQPCKTIKKAVDRCKTEKVLHIHTTENCNKFDTEPIIIDGHLVILNNDDEVVCIMTALDEKKVKSGDALFCVKSEGRFFLDRADICVNTKRESGRNQGLIVVEGEGSQIELEDTNISNIETGNELSCVLIECKSGESKFQSVKISHFVSSCALILAEASQKIKFLGMSLDSITTKSKTQSVLTVMGGCQSTTVDDCTFTNCWSIEHKFGGAIYLEITNDQSSFSFYRDDFSNCSCKSSNSNTDHQFVQLNEESEGGAIFIQVTDEATKLLKLSIFAITFTDCTAEKGEYVFMTLPAGREQIDEEQFCFEMEEIYGKPNYMLLEDRKEARTIDLLTDNENRLPYHSENIFVGEAKTSNEKTCGRKEEPCSQLSGIAKHETWKNRMSVYIIGKVFVSEPVSGCERTKFSSMTDSFSMPSATNEQNRGTLQIGANMKNSDAIAIFGGKHVWITMEHLEIEYPDAIEGDAIDLIFGSMNFALNDVVFRPWYTGLKGENILGGEGELLPYTLIKVEAKQTTITKLVIYGRNKNITHASQRECDETTGSIRDYQNAANVECLNNDCEEDDQLCSWDSGLLFLNESSLAYVNDSSFIDIGDGAILSHSSTLHLNNCSFINNHPIDAGWEKYPSLQHNIRFKGLEYDWISVESLTAGSDGLDGKPFGMLSDVEAYGTAAKNMDSYFFSPILKNATLKKDDAINKNDRQDKNENEKEVEAVVHGSYLFPCGLTFEASKKRKGEEMKWTNCPVSEYTNETEMNVRIPSSLFEVDDYTSVVCRLTYSNGIINGENKHSTNIILVKQKKDDQNENHPIKLTKAQLVAIIACTCAFAVVVVAVIVTVVCVVRNKKRRQYREIKDIKQ